MVSFKGNIKNKSPYDAYNIQKSFFHKIEEILYLLLLNSEHQGFDLHMSCFNMNVDLVLLHLSCFNMNDDFSAATHELFRGFSYVAPMLIDESKPNNTTPNPVGLSIIKYPVKKLNFCLRIIFVVAFKQFE